MKSKCNLIGNDLSKERLRRSLTTISILIEKGNDDLWPIFEKLEEELIRLKLKKKRLSRYATDQIL